MINKILIGGLAIGAILGTLAFFGLTPYGKTVVKEVFGAPTGTTWSANSPDNGIIMAPATGSATTSSIVNNSGSDLLVTQVNVGCEGLGTSLTAYSGAALAALKLTIATSSAAAIPTTVSTGGVAILTIATSSADFVLATSSPSTATSSANLVWNAGSAMVFGFNATNTASCHVGVSTISL